MSEHHGGALASRGERLRTRRAALMKRIRHQLTSGGAEDNDFLNDSEVSQLEHELVELIAINAALRRIQQGLHVVCADCGQSALVPDLDAQAGPWTCPDCQQRRAATLAACHGSGAA
ncbi:MAG: hypothetical protein V4463_25510 [Pseudomonadota bacterium]